ncbi:MAG: hypothetical protein ABII00_11915 [Elusimicrobiota bacterium]
MAREPTERERELAACLIGVDTLFGGDALHESGRHHVIADTWFSGRPPPDIYHDPFAKAARESAQGVSGAKDVLGDREAVEAFAGRHRLRKRLEALQNYRPAGDHDGELTRLAGALGLMLDTALAGPGGEGAPPFDRRYEAGIGGLLDGASLAGPAAARARLEEALAGVGYEVTPSRSLRDTCQAWRADQRPLKPEEVAPRARVIIAGLLEAMRRGVFSKLDFGLPGHEPDLRDVPFDGYRCETVSGVRFTGSNIYRGGEREGSPLLRGLFEYNTDHPVREAGLAHLCAHEIIGHYLNSAAQDLLWRGGKIPFLATMGTMCTPYTVFQEGWAQCIFELLYGGREAAAEAHGRDLLVALAQSDLEDIAKHDAPIRHQRDGESLDAVRRYIAEECVQPDPIVEKLSGGWARHPVIGPMYGPAYLVGRRAVAGAIRRRGVIPVARIGYHLEGYVDIRTFKGKAAQL